MGDDDRVRWDERYRRYEREVDAVRLGSAGAAAAAGLSPRLAAYTDLLPHAGSALDLACGSGAVAVWLARRGLDVLGVDVSPVAIGQARAVAVAAGVADRCEFAVWDLDGGLPDGPPVDLVMCHRFRDARLDAAVAARLAPGGVLAIVARSEVGATPGRFRVAAGELPRAFGALGGLDVLASGEGGGEAWLVARARPVGA